MAEGMGTLERIALGVTEALMPLEDLFSEEEVLVLFAQLGIQFPEDLVRRPGFQTALNTGKTAAGDLLPLARQLIAAVEDEDVVEITRLGIELVGAIRLLISTFDSISDELKSAAAGLPGLGADDIIEFAEQLAQRLLEFLLVEHLDIYHPVLLRFAAFLGVVEIETRPGDPLDPAKPPFTEKRLHFDRLGDLVQSPLASFGSLYNWGGSTIDGQVLLDRVHDILFALGVPVADYPAAPGSLATLDFFWLQLKHDTTLAIEGLTLEFRFPIIAGRLERPINPRWSFVVDTEWVIESGIVASLTPPAELTVSTGVGSVEGRVTTGITGISPDPDDPFILFGQTGQSRLQMARAEFSLGVTTSLNPGTGEVTGQPIVKGTLTDGRLVIDSSGSGGVLSVLLSNLRIDAPFDLRFTWSPATGARFEGNAALDIRHPVSLTLGPLTVQTIYVRVGLDSSGRIPIELSGAMSLALGPLLATVDRLGLSATLTFPDGGGNLGPVNLDIDFKPPTAIGLLIEASAITGGGFLGIDPGPPERYAGALALKLTDFAVVAFGMFERTPTGQISFVMVLGIRFSPSLQLGYGFALTGIGGMVGLNRRADVDALRSRLVSGGASNVLFCEDPIRNAPTLFGDLAAIFPAADGIFVVGPTLQIGWLVFIRFDLGIVIELPGPSKIIILGTARFQVGGQAGKPAVVQIRLDILGILDFAHKLISFDAVLVDSKLLQIFVLTGTAAFRLSYGDRPYVLLTVGGFHPSFNPEPAVVPQQARVALTYDTGGSTRLSVRLETYLAVTTNTFQLGAALEASVEVGPINANGYLNFDALIQFSPFYFDVEFSAGFRVRYKSHTLAGVKFKGSLTGPGPIVLSGKLCIEILFFDACFGATFTLGDSSPSALTPISSLVSALQPELGEPANLEATGGEDRQVALSLETDAPRPVIAPQGQLQWTQKRVPLNTLVERMEGVPLSSAQAAVVTSPARQGVVQDFFSPGTYQNLSESEAVNLPPFQRLESGIQLGFDLQTSGTVVHEVEFVTIRLPEETPLSLDLLLAPALVLSTALGRRAPGRVPDAASAIGVVDETWTLRGADGAVAGEGLSPADAHMRMRRTGGMALPAVEASEPLDLGGI